MTIKDVWSLQSNDDVWILADHLADHAEAIDFSTLENDQDCDLFYTKAMEDFAFFAPRCMFIKGADAKRHQLVFNKAQWYLHAIIEWQLKTFGMVRIVVVKGRQQGISTYLEARAYWKSIHRENYNVTILTHLAEATGNLFAMAKRYHEHCPADLRPKTGSANAKQMTFPDLDSQYTVATAGSSGTGRSQTSHYFHGSEVAFWPNAAEHASGILQTISNGDDTEVYMESTADGIGNYFHEQWEGADIAGSDINPFGSGYIRVFIPWYWEPRYREQVPEKFVLSDEEKKYARLYGCDEAQMFWRRKKIKEMDNDPRRFQRDYPATPEEAFNSSGDNLLITGDMVMDARLNYREQRMQPYGPVVMGVDVARQGDDATCFVIRQGRVVKHTERMYKAKAHEVATRLTQLRREWDVQWTFIDGTGGYGTAVSDVLEDRNTAENITLVHFSESAEQQERFTNVRTEMWWNIKEWLAAGAVLPDNDDWGRDLCAPHYSYQRDQIKLEGKDEIKKRIGRSPDLGDALGLTFRHPVRRRGSEENHEPEVV